ncbi:MAG TPA: methyltransferase domain-containing protein [Acidimicrobiales bacterium]|nr:methyltransferase domain-containing protein [Acidimicrobiales bacterium]
MPDDFFEDPRLAAVYDPLDPDRSDLDLYLAMLDEFAARSVLDIGCGTGTFACLLAERGIEVIGLDPAGSSLDVARTKLGADRVRWIHGDVTALPPLQVDLVTMTANVAQVFLTDDEWHQTLAGAHAALRPGGHLVFEIRDPSKEAWRNWTKDNSHTKADVPGIGLVEAWFDGAEAKGPLVTFSGTYIFHADGTVLTPTSTLRFRTRDEIERSLAAAGFDLVDVRDAPDRPGLEFVFVAERP